MKPNSKEAKVLALYSQGLRDRYEIAAKAGCTLLTEVEYLRRNGISLKTLKQNFKKRGRNQKAKAIISELMAGKKIASQIAREYGVSKQYVSELKLKELKEKAYE